MPTQRHENCAKKTKKDALEPQIQSILFYEAQNFLCKQ